LARRLKTIEFNSKYSHKIAPEILHSHVFSQDTGATGSITFILRAQSLSHSNVTSICVAPCVKTYRLSASTVNPLRRMPQTVGNRGSFQKDFRPQTIVIYALIKEYIQSSYDLPEKQAVMQG